MIDAVDFSLVRCGEDGRPLTRIVGFVPPWVSYVAVEIARQTQPGIVVAALTLKERNAATRILERLGFSVAGAVHDRDAGEVWEWHVPTREI